MSDKKIFPIHNNSACVYKWGWNTFRLYNGTSSSCHRVTPVVVAPSDFQNFHNTPEVLADRKLMLDGEWPINRGCEYCSSIEAVGGISDRLYHNAIPGLTPLDFEKDNNNLTVTPRVQEIYLNNTCDLACVYCTPHFSSKINYELKQYGPSSIGTTFSEKSSMHEQYLKLFMNWLEHNYYKIGRLSILGGEPLIQKEFWELLDFIKQKKHSNLELTINTNLNCDSKVLEKYVKTLRQLLVDRRIGRADIQCSIDCLGPQQEFVRYGLDLSQWKKNFEFIIQHKWLYISVHQVVTSLTIFTMQELQEQIAQYKKINSKINQEYHLVDGPNEVVYHPTIFGPTFFAEKLNDLLNSYPISNEQDQLAKQRLEGISKLIANSQQNNNRLALLKETLNQLDFRRATDWKSLFPDIDKFFINNGI